MGAPVGNSFYLMRHKDGRNPIYETPQELEVACFSYFEKCDENPWHKNEAIKSGDNAGEIIPIPTARPYTEKGLFIYLGINRQTWKNYCAKEDFVAICTHVEDIIFTQKFEGAAVGAFNANIIARDLGLREKTEIGGIDGNPISVSNEHRVIFEDFSGNVQSIQNKTDAPNEP